MTNPINLQIKRADNSWDIIEAAPFVNEVGQEWIPTGVFQLYRGYPEFDSNLFDADALRERYMESISLMGEDNPNFLGELHFTGIGFFEWKYEGKQLQESEVWQIVDCIQDYAAGKVPLVANGIILPKEDQPQEVPLTFKYGKNQRISHIRIEEMEGSFMVLFNGDPIAQIELLEDDWEVTEGDIDDRDLLDEVIRRIKANL
jgi:hypothetical protein